MIGFIDMHATISFLIVLIAGPTTQRVATNRLRTVRFVTVTAGADHVCGLTDAGAAYCWGANQFGQLGIGAADTIAHTTPARVSGDLKFTALLAGFTHTCGLVRDGSAYCWGANESGQLGDGTLTSRFAPERVKTDVRFQQIGPGGTHTCGVSIEGVGYCWGGNWHGQIGEGSRSGDTPCCFLNPVPVRTTLRFRSVIAGGIHSCGITLDGAAYCWGSPQEGRLGTGSEDARNKSADKTVPAAVVGKVKFTSIAPRAWHSCGLTTKREAMCWGGNSHLALGVDPEIGVDVPQPTPVIGLSDFSDVSAGHFHTCALTRRGVAYCWGRNTEGELGDGTRDNAVAPRRVATDHLFASIAAGGNLVVGRETVQAWGFTCGITADNGDVLCWGDNRHGSLGDGTTVPAILPTPIANSARKPGLDRR